MLVCCIRPGTILSCSWFVECGLVSSSSVTTADELVEAACLLKETALTVLREDKKSSGSVKCFTCQKPGHKSCDCPD